MAVYVTAFLRLSVARFLEPVLSRAKRVNDGYARFELRYIQEIRL
jgi:hypothetical protein